MMRIGFDAKRYFFNQTGLGNYSHSLVSALAQSFPEEEYYLYSPKNVHCLKPYHIRYPSGPAALFPSLWRIYGIAGAAQRDRLNIYHGLSHELPVGMVKTGIKTVVTIHDVIYKKYPEQYSAIDRGIYHRKVAHACLTADAIVAISEQTKQDIIQYYQASADKIKVIYQSCDPIFEQLPSEKLVSEVSLKHQLPQKYLLYVGSLVQRKNIINLLAAFGLLNDPDLHLLLVGNGGAYRKQIEQYMQGKPWQNRVRILPNVATRELPVLYQQAQAFVYPSLYEGFGIPIIEALWSGTPVVTTQGGCFAEAGGLYSLYVDTQNPDALAQALQKALTNGPLREQMRNNGLQYVRRFKPDVIAAQMMELYQSLLNR
jgi:glycosyltransferase involved in cell wall biosynthesis